MNETILIIIAAFVALMVGWVVSLVYQGTIRSKRNRLAKERAAELVKQAETRVKETILEAKEEAVRIRAEAEAENRQGRSEIGRQEKKLAQKADNLDRKIESFERREGALAKKEKEIETGLSRVERLKQEQRERLEVVSAMSSAEAKAQLLTEVERETRDDLAQRMQQVEAQIKVEADDKARGILAEALQRCASEVAGEATVSVVALPSDDMKGRLIGREGRNIRALEAATGVDLIVDDTPEAVSLSCFDPVRREIARVALEKLILDGRIHPGRIEEIVEKAKKEVEIEMKAEGERVMFKAGVVGLHSEIIGLLGRLKYRFSYGQNMIGHSLEVAHLSAALATDIGANVNIARMAGLLHDIGKAVDHDIEGSHAMIGARILKRLGFGSEVVNGVAEHHGETGTIGLYGFIVSAADAISSARPGARMESVERYLKRVSTLENIASSFPGVEKSFAIQAGREVRILVKPSEIDDLASVRLARDIARKVEEGLEYPGQIKVTVIRETRSVDYAK